MEGKWLLPGAQSHFTNKYQLLSASTEQGFSWVGKHPKAGILQSWILHTACSQCLQGVWSNTPGCKVSWEIHHNHGAPGASPAEQRAGGHSQLFPIFLVWKLQKHQQLALDGKCGVHGRNVPIPNSQCPQRCARCHLGGQRVLAAPGAHQGFCLLPQQAFNAAAVVHHMKKLHMSGHGAAESSVPGTETSEPPRPSSPTGTPPPAAPSGDKDTAQGPSQG